ncbi:hypothetical protein RFI_00453, partial [Reticulomyxa filosa]
TCHNRKHKNHKDQMKKCIPLDSVFSSRKLSSYNVTLFFHYFTKKLFLLLLLFLFFQLTIAKYSAKGKKTNNSNTLKAIKPLTMALVNAIERWQTMFYEGKQKFSLISRLSLKTDFFSPQTVVQKQYTLCSKNGKRKNLYNIWHLSVQQTIELSKLFLKLLFVLTTKLCFIFYKSKENRNHVQILKKCFINFKITLKIKITFRQFVSLQNVVSEGNLHLSQILLNNFLCFANYFYSKCNTTFNFQFRLTFRFAVEDRFFFKFVFVILLKKHSLFRKAIPAKQTKSKI